MSEQAPEQESAPQDVEALAEQIGVGPAMMQSLLAQIGGVAGPVPGAPTAMSQGDLMGLVAETSAAVTGRQGLTGRPFSGILPWWVQENPELTRLATEAANVWDPYLGFDEQGDERVYMGGREGVRVGGQTYGLPKEPQGELPAELVFGGVLGDSGVKTGEQAEIARLNEPITLEEIRRAHEIVERREPVEGEGVFGIAGEMLSAASGLVAEAASSPEDRFLLRRVTYWLGNGWQDRPAPAPENPEGANAGDATRTLMQVQNLPFTWDEEEVREAMRRMRLAGHKVITFDEMVQVWQGMSSRAAMMYSLSEGKRKVTPWDVLDITKREMEDAGNFINYESGSQTTTHKTVANITEGAAWSTLQQTLSQMLGRDPDDQEVRDFAYRMNQLAAKNPRITETVTKFRAGEQVGSDSTTTGGIDSGDLAQEAYEDAQADPDYAEFQSATTYFNAALAALGAIGEG